MQTTRESTHALVIGIADYPLSDHGGDIASERLSREYLSPVDADPQAEQSNQHPVFKAEVEENFSIALN